MAMPHHVKRRVLEHGKILHIASDEPDLDALARRQVFNGLQLGRRDVEDGCLRTELGENHRVPAPAGGQPEDASARQSHPLEPPHAISMMPTPSCGSCAGLTRSTTPTGFIRTTARPRSPTPSDAASGSLLPPVRPGFDAWSTSASPIPRRPVTRTTRARPSWKRQYYPPACRTPSSARRWSMERVTC